MNRNIRFVFAGCAVALAGLAVHVVQTDQPKNDPAFDAVAKKAAEQPPIYMYEQPAVSGNGRPVLIIPGFLGNDRMMSGWHDALRARGYATYGWDAGWNTGPDRDTAEHLKRHLRDIFNNNHQTKVSIVGYSLGGIYARELARYNPDMVERVITVASPFGSRQNGKPDARVHEIQQFFGSTDTDPRTPPPVPTTSVFSTEDWVSNWKTSLNLPSERSENIRIGWGHVAMMYNPVCSNIILDRLSSRQNHWSPFRLK